MTDLHPVLKSILRRGGVVAIAMVFAAPAAFGTPANKKAMVKFFGPHLAGKLDSCATCHVRADPQGAESLEEFPHNPFGKSLHTQEGKISGRLETVIREDADGDGQSNLDEFLTGSFPGESTQQGSVADPTLLAQKKAAFAKWRDRYQWEPFDKVIPPAVPTVSKASWVRNEIDAFIAAEHEARNLSPRPEADRAIWLRRVTIDLTGLTPTPNEIRAFLADDSETACEKVVDRLLESPRYGERWGRHWMDIWRYSDWAGYKAAVRRSQPHIWRWRDWIVESLNDDKGYDRMILEMLAADELAPEDPDALRATGYLVRSFDVGSRDVWLDNVVTHTSQAFLGVTMGCVKCHDHMYDPIPQENYYAMRAIFEGYHVRTDRVPGELDTAKTGLVRAFDRTIEPKTYLFERGDERFPDKSQPVPPGVPEALGGRLEVEEKTLPRFAYQPWKRDFVKRELMAVRDEALSKSKAELDALAAEATKNVREEVQLKLAAAELAKAALESEFEGESLEDAGRKDSDEWKAVAENTFDLQRKASLAEAKYKLIASENSKAKAKADMNKAKASKDAARQTAATKAMSAATKSIDAAKKSLAAAEKKMKTKMTTAYKARQANYPNKSTGRRLAFAQWLASAENPLTARVAMNHLWLRHFGEAIVPTVQEFGANGREPSHPALLDWLAAEFMDSEWSMKAMHRKMVLSAAYRMAGTPDDANLAADPDNRFLWRMPSRRMEGEVVRDNLLWIAGRLDGTLGGPDIDNKQGQDSQRRSIYLRHAHEKLVEFVQIFDGPKVSECYRREESVQPHQALALHNSPLTNRAAESLAASLETQSRGDTVRFLNEAYLTILGREPKAEELDLCREFLAGAESGNESASPERARERLLTVLLNHNDFVTIR